MGAFDRILVAAGEGRAPAPAAALAARLGAEASVVPAARDAAGAEAVIAAAAARSAGLLVLSPMGGMKRDQARLDEADWRILHGSPCPVLVARGTIGAGYRTILVAVDPFHAHDRAATLDDALIDAAQALREPSGSSLRLLHCYFPAAYLPLRAPGASPSSLVHRPGNSIDEHRAGLLDLARRHGISADDVLIEPGDPREAIPDAVARLDPDLVVTGIVARSRARRLFLGSTAEPVLARLACDFLVVKPAG